MAQQDEEFQQIMKDGKLQRERIDAHVEKFLEAAKAGDTKELHAMLENNQSDQQYLQQHDANKRTALHFAAHSNNAETIKLLLDKGANVNAVDWEGMTPLMYALKANGTESAKLLIDTPGVDLTIITSKGVTLLHSSVMAGNTELVKYLVEKGATIMPHAQSESGSVLHFTATEENLDLASFLVEHEPKLMNTKDENGMTPLHLACAYNNQKLALFLINNGADVNVASHDGTTPLHIAADSGNKVIVQSLIEHGVVQKLDATGHTPIMCAIKNKTKDIEELLQKVTIDVERPGTGAQTPANASRISPDQLKDNGNKAFGQKDYELAIHWYSLAIDVDSILCEAFSRQSTLAHILYSNRSASYYHQKKYKEALEDANHAIQLSPDWSKGYLRKGHALAALEQKEESEAAFAKVKVLEEVHKNENK